ncbi:MAG TPA: phosphate-binding protein, partial [Pseudomonadales bacterium]|nr:phosphate-binding protein [Pseudomonadales bacterium]
KPLAPLEAEFLKMVLSKNGQEIVVKDGFIPMTPKMIEKAMKDAGL